MPLGQRKWWNEQNMADDPEPSGPDHIATLLELAKLLTAPDRVKKQLADLAEATAAHKQAVSIARTEQRKVEAALAALEVDKQKHVDRLAADLKAHQEKMAAAEAGLALVKKQAADLKQAADKDRAEAQQLKQRMAEKMKLIEAA